MKSRIFIILLGFVCASLPPSTATAQQCSYLQLIMSNPNHPNDIRCWPPNWQIGYYYSLADEPFLGSDVEVGDAAESWGASSGYCLQEKFIGSDGDIFWVTDPFQWINYGHKANAAAVTVPSFTSSGVYLNGFEIHLNCAYFQADQWGNNGNPNQLDLETVVLHEFGHVLGLDDVTSSYCINQTVMYYNLHYGDCWYLHDIDIAAIRYLCDNSAGRLVDFEVTPRGGAVEIACEIIGHNTDHYRIERRLPGEDLFRPLEGAFFYPVTLRAGDRYEYIDPHGSPDAFYRLVEQDRGGHTIVHAVEKPLQSIDCEPSPPLTFDPGELRARLERWASRSIAVRNAGMHEEQTTPDWIAIGPDDYVNSFGILSLAYWHEQDDMTTGVTDLQYIDSYWGGDLDAYIVHLYEHGTQYIVLVGDASDHALWDDEDVWSVNGWDAIKPSCPSQPQYDIIPADYYLDQEFPDCSMSYFTPYYASELPKSDVDDDGYPEIVVGRIPAHNVSDVLAYGAKAVEYLQNCSGGWVDEASLWIDCRHLSGNDGYYTDSLGMDLLDYLPADFNTHVLRNAPCPDCYGYAEREAMAIDEFDDGRSIIISFGTVANRYRLNDWFCVQLGFTVSKLDDNEIFPFLLGVSCDQAAFDEAETSDGRPICERLLFDDQRGAIGIFGPTRGSWQKGNYLMGRFVLEYLYDKGAQSLGHACLAAQRDLMWQYDCYRALARSYVYLGDPALFLSGAVPGEITAVEDNPAPHARFNLQANYPNPFNPTTTIEYSVSKTATVDLSVYDVTGRLVRVLDAGTREPGVYTATWDGTDMKGEWLASGIYFCRLKLEGEISLTRKMVLIR